MRRVLGVFPLFLCLQSVSSVWSQPNLAGATETRLALEGLHSTGSVLMIAAHPDDENTALLAWLARGRKVRTGYLSITRGEGGQNLIGSEQGALLGLIRTQELLAARRIDGAEQFFTSAVDFGFSKTAEETLKIWGREKVLGDIVFVIRKFRPDAIVLRFSGTPRDGHGHHQASAILGKEAFVAAADPKRFPEQLSEVQPWQTKRILWNVFAFTREQEQQQAKIADRIEVDLGEFDPVLGYSWSEIAGMSRSQHESQGMGSPERRGSFRNALVPVAGDKAKADLLEGADSSGRSPELNALLRQAAESYRPEQPGPAISLLIKARTLTAGSPLMADIDHAIGLCGSLWLDATISAPAAAPGSIVKITAEVVNRSKTGMQLQSIQIGDLPPIAGDAPLEYNRPVTKSIDWTVTKADRLALRGQPEAGPVLQARFTIVVEGTPITFLRPVWNRYVDKIRGELTRPFEVVPPLSVRFAEPVVLFPDRSARPISIQLQSYSGKQSGALRLDTPPGWRTDPASLPFNFAQTGQEMTLRFFVTPPEEAATANIKAVAVTGGTEVSTGVQKIEYSHIPPITIFPPAAASAVRTDVAVLSKRVGYVMGAGDEIPGSLRQMGCEVTLLSADDLARSDLSRFDAIVTGVRAWNVRADLRANRQRLLNFAEAGGTVVVQYNVAEGGPFSPETGALDSIGPYPIRTGRDRVTVEEAPIEVLRPDHPLLTTPNKITSADFEGWVQERGLYFASEWDPKYETLIASHDPGEKPLPGGLLFNRYGKGAWVFTAYSWFRQLPAGVPGSYRMFANLLSAGKKP